MTGTGPVASLGDRDTTAISPRDMLQDATRPEPEATEPRAVGGMASARVTTPTTRVLGAYAWMALASMPARELRRRFCDVFDAPPPTRRRDDETWLRHALAPHAIDARVPHGRAGVATDDAAATPGRRRLLGGWGAIRGFQTDAARYEGVGPIGLSFPAPGDAGVGDATDDDASDDGRDDAFGAFGKTPSPVDRRRDRRGSFDLDSRGVPGSGADAAFARSPNASEVLARVARCTPVSTCGWAMATAAAARAIAAAGEKSALALSARAECERLAAEAGKAVKRAMKAATSAARVRDGTDPPVPFAALPRAIAERVARDRRRRRAPGPQARRPPSKGGEKRGARLAVAVFLRDRSRRGRRDGRVRHRGGARRGAVCRGGRGVARAEAPHDDKRAGARRRRGGAGRRHLARRRGRRRVPRVRRGRVRPLGRGRRDRLLRRMRRAGAPELLRAESASRRASGCARGARTAWPPATRTRARLGRARCAPSPAARSRRWTLRHTGTWRGRPQARTRTSRVRPASPRCSCGRTSPGGRRAAR